MALETAASAAMSASAKWLWDSYGKDLTDKFIGQVRDQWAAFKWQNAEAVYRKRMLKLYSTTRILGYLTPIVIEDIFTDAYVLDKPTAFQNK